MSLLNESVLDGMLALAAGDWYELLWDLLDGPFPLRPVLLLLLRLGEVFQVSWLALWLVMALGRRAGAVYIV